MREIKFRAWDKANNEMLDIEDLHWDDCTREFLIRTTMYSDYFDTEDMILMQYTGLKDKNGKEIYEGDIIQSKYGRKYNVRYAIDRGGFVPFACGDGCGCCDDEVVYSPETVEVIGNIYDNPELIKED